MQNVFKSICIMTTPKNLYKQEFIDHYHNPRQRGVAQPSNFFGSATNPLCGDMIQWTGVVKNGLFEQLFFMGQGCILSQAFASMLAERLQGVSLNQASMITVSEYVAELGMSLGPTRTRCVALALEALQAGIKKYAESPQAS